MKVNLQQVTPNAEEQVVEIARVSSSRKDKTAEPHKLINYLIKHKHWSPFEHAIMTVEIETSRGIAAQLLRHRSFTFQEFSQRYQDVTKLGDEIFEDIELRKAGATNRQSSLEPIDPKIETEFGTLMGKQAASKQVDQLLKHAESVYSKLIEAGVATECARFVLPLATKTRLYMTGNIRSWVHFLELRDDEHAQKEVRLIAKQIKKFFIQEFPNVAKALDFEVKQEKRKEYVQLSDNKRKALIKDSKKLDTKELADRYKVTTATVRNIIRKHGKTTK